MKRAAILMTVLSACGTGTVEASGPEEASAVGSSWDESLTEPESAVTRPAPTFRVDCPLFIRGESQDDGIWQSISMSLAVLSADVQLPGTTNPGFFICRNGGWGLMVVSQIPASVSPESCEVRSEPSPYSPFGIDQLYFACAEARPAAECSELREPCVRDADCCQEAVELACRSGECWYAP